MKSGVENLHSRQWELLLEDFRQQYKQCEVLQAAYVRFEIFAFGGTGTAYAFLYTAQKPPPLILWFALPALLALCAFRCGTYYYAINYVLCRHIKDDIERKVYAGSAIVGSQTYQYNRKTSPTKHVAFSAFAWAVLILGTLIIAFDRAITHLLS